MRLFIFLTLTIISRLYSQPIMNIHLNDGRVVQQFIGEYGMSMPFFNVHVGNTNWLNNSLNYNSITDQNGNIYKTIIIGAQEWMAENLRATSFSNGDPIPNRPKRADSLAINNLPYSYAPGWYFVHNDSTLNIPYGKLYTPLTITDQRNICPVGWHVPNYNDWLILFNNYGGMSNAADEITTANNQYWHEGNPLGSNLSGFSLLPSSGLNVNNYVGGMGVYYTSTLVTSAGTQILYCFNIWTEIINSQPIDINDPNVYVEGAAIRCIKD